MFRNMSLLCFLICLYPESSITLYSLTFETGLDDLVCVLFRPKKEKRKKSRNYNRNFNVKFKLLVSFFSFF